VGFHKPSLPPVPEDAVDRAARRVASEKRKEKKDAKKARARERMRARDALERLRRRQERDGIPREPSSETPDDDDDDEDDDEDDDMAARLGLSPDLSWARGRRASPRNSLAETRFGANTKFPSSGERLWLIGGGWLADDPTELVTDSIYRRARRWPVNFGRTRGGRN
jgi:hypothetical protein